MKFTNRLPVLSTIINARPHPVFQSGLILTHEWREIELEVVFSPLWAVYERAFFRTAGRRRMFDPGGGC
jgi:hypothetical protein